MLIRQMGAILVSIAVVLAGFSKRSQLKGEIVLLQSLEQALAQLKELVCYEKCPLGQALTLASEGKESEIRKQFQAAVRTLSAEDPDIRILGHCLPIGTLNCAGQAQERILSNLAEEVWHDRMGREARLEERSRSCMSVAVAVSAICAIVLL